MNTENFEELKKTLKYLGFGELMNDALGKALDSGKQQFTRKRPTNTILAKSIR